MTDHVRGAARAGPVPRPIVRAQRQLGEHLRTWRKLQSLTIAQVADRANVGVATSSRLERGEGATLENVLRVARALGVPDQLAGAVDPYDTALGRARADELLPTRVRGSVT